VALREAHIVAKLLAFTGDVARTHGLIPSIQWSILAVFTP
jgi:hypothetical protein